MTQTSETNNQRKNLYFRPMLRRQNVLKEAIFDFFLGICSFPRLIIEVFTRRNFGERYFSMGAVLFVSFLLLFFPPVAYFLRAIYGSYGVRQTPFAWRIISSYAFLVVFLIFAFKRQREVVTSVSSFDFGRFSLSSGDFNGCWYRLFQFFHRGDARVYQILYEPLPFFLGGIVLILLGQFIGYVLVISAVSYAISYMAAFHRGDNFILDIIDEQIMNEEMEKSFVEDLDASETRGVRFYANKPKSRELRQKIAAAFFEDDDATAVS